MDLMSPAIMLALKVKYVACLKHGPVSVPDQNGKIVAIIPQYKVLWTDMEIADAKPSDLVSFSFYNGYTIISVNLKLGDVVIVDKIGSNTSENKVVENNKEENKE